MGELSSFSWTTLTDEITEEALDGEMSSLFLTCPLYKWSTRGFSKQHGTPQGDEDEITVNISLACDETLFSG